MSIPCSPFVPPFWLSSGHAQTLWAPFFGRSPSTAYRREIWPTPDADQIAVDHIDGDPQGPVLVLFHGLGSSSRGHYARALAGALRARNWNGVFINFRGCGGLENLQPRAYHAGDSAEILWILARVAERYPNQTRYAVGVSLGGNALLKALGEQGGAIPIAGAVTVCAPVDLPATAAFLRRGRLRFYERYFVHTLKRDMGRYQHRFPNMADWPRIHRARNLREFDDVFTAPVHGFPDAQRYWEAASAGPGLHKIRTRTLLLNTHDDPIVPLEAVRSWPRSDWVQPCFSAHGGHVGFVRGRFPGHLDWLPGQIIRFLDGEEIDAKT